MVDEGYRGPQVCKLVGISYRQLDYWARTDLIRPSVADARGSGTQRIYSYRDLVELKVIKSLLDAGVSLQSARKAIAFLRHNLGGDIASASLVLNGADSVLLVRSDGELVDVMLNGQGVFSVVGLGGVVQALDTAITELRPAVLVADTVDDDAPVVQAAQAAQAAHPSAGDGARRRAGAEA